MKSRLTVLFLILLLTGFAQAASYEGKNDIPPFRIGLTNRSYFDNLSLKKRNQVLFIYFLPDCNDCRSFTELLVKNIKYLQNIQIVMITNSSLIQVKQFEVDFRLKKYSNLIAGTEGYTNAFQRQFNIESFPFVAAFNKNGYLIKTFRYFKDPNSLINEMKVPERRVSPWKKLSANYCLFLDHNLYYP